jgi:hypothetical protein
LSYRDTQMGRIIDALADLGDPSRAMSPHGTSET